MRPSVRCWLIPIVTLGIAATDGAVGETPADRTEEPLRLEARPFAEGTPVVPPTAALAGGSDYRIGRQDLLEIAVFDVEELDQTVRVADDGSITMPLLGKLRVAGLTKFELERMIAEQLDDRFIRDPQVTVFIKEYESKKVAVSGAVKNPGTYEMLGQKTILEMLSEAGGLDQDLGKEIIIFRKPVGEPTRRLAVDLDRLVYRAEPELNLIVEPGDIIYVPAVEKIRIFVSGAVRNPDLYEVPRDEPVTVLKAVTLAGGVTDRAAEKKIQIIRNDENGERTILLVNLRKVKQGRVEDPLLRKDDIVLVPESFF
ncbi:MAG TPA: polysaccharide biosynthesis/export family protein [Candidatus Polarisedimenticolaceae bacterium]|nr:polysaccharide biosynthesis/export family protein [Candidatus Polarisedimenticolaceae bacterium]